MCYAGDVADIPELNNVEGCRIPFFTGRGLPPLRAARLRACELAVESYHQHRLRAGRALRIIYREELYAEYGQSWKDYLAFRWDMAASTACQLMKYADIDDAFTTAKARPHERAENEAQARHLHGIATEDLIPVMRLAHKIAQRKAHFRVFANDVKDAVYEFRHPQPSKPAEPATAHEADENQEEGVGTPSPVVRVALSKEAKHKIASQRRRYEKEIKETVEDVRQALCDRRFWDNDDLPGLLQVVTNYLEGLRDVELQGLEAELRADAESDMCDKARVWSGCAVALERAVGAEPAELAKGA